MYFWSQWINSKQVRFWICYMLYVYRYYFGAIQLVQGYKVEYMNEIKTIVGYSSEIWQYSENLFMVSITLLDITCVHPPHSDISNWLALPGGGLWKGPINLRHLWVFFSILRAKLKFIINKETDHTEKQSYLLDSVMVESQKPIRR